MITVEQAREVVGTTAYDDSGTKVGKVGSLYFDDQSGRPEWVTVSTGLFGGKENFVPVTEASLHEGSITLPFSKDTIKQAPHAADAGQDHVSIKEEADLYAFYGDAKGASGAAGRGRQSDKPQTGHDKSGPTTDDAMTRSEEHLHVGTERQERGRARLRKYVVTEEEQVRVPVSREEVYVEREPITEENRGAATDGPAISEEEHEVTLYEERPVVATEATPVERVRMEKTTVRDEETVRGQVREERIEAEGGENNKRGSA